MQSAELNIRQRTLALIVAVRRGAALLDHPDPQKPFQVGDIIYLVGSTEAIRKGIDLLEADSGQTGDERETPEA